MPYCATKPNYLDREPTSEQATAVGPLMATLLTVKLDFIVLVTRHTEQADVPPAEGSMGHKAPAAGAARSFHRQPEPVAGCRAVHLHVNFLAGVESLRHSSGEANNQSVRKLKALSYSPHCRSISNF